MTDEQINAAIAEACGWTQIHVKDFSESGVPCFMTMGLPPGFIHVENSLILPDYCNDLNAMHEAEQALWRKDWNLRYDFVNRLGEMHMLDANARQRAEAFLSTIKKEQNNE